MRGASDIFAQYQLRIAWWRQLADATALRQIPIMGFKQACVAYCDALVHDRAFKRRVVRPSSARRSGFTHALALLCVQLHVVSLLVSRFHCTRTRASSPLVWPLLLKLETSRLAA